MIPTSAILIFCLLMISHLIRFFIEEKRKKGVNRRIKEQEKIELEELLRNRENRIDQSEFSEDSFWELIDDIFSRSGNHYRNFLGVFRDKISKFSPEELIRIDNLINRLFISNIHYDIWAASRIVFKEPKLGGALMLMNVMMINGRIFFYQACLNPNLLLGKEFTHIDGRFFNDIIAEEFYRKTGKLIPVEMDEQELIVAVVPCEDDELPSKFPDLWGHFEGKS